MKATVAYIVYIEDQREPSFPQLADWDLSDSPTKEELHEHARRLFLEVCGDEEEAVVCPSEYSDIQVTDDCDLHLYIALPVELKPLVA